MLTLNNYYRLEELTDHVNQTIYNYYNMNQSNLLEEYEFVIYENETTRQDFVSQPVLDAYFMRFDDRKYFEGIDYNLTKTNLGPFELEQKELTSFLRNLTNFRINFELKHKIPTAAAAPFD